MKTLKYQRILLKSFIVILFSFSVLYFSNSYILSQNPSTINNKQLTLTAACGGGTGYSSVTTSIDFGCSGKGNPILDLTFAIIRFLAAGVGVVIIASTIYAGIQYIISTGDPQKTNVAIGRIRSNIIALILFIFTYVIINYLVPGGLIH